MEPTAATNTSTRSWPRRLLNRMEIDRAVFFAVGQRVWQLSAGVVTVLLMTVFFTPQVQGYYYTFASLIALQTFFELGFSIVVVNVCSHEWAQLRMEGGRITGDASALSRLVSIGRLLFGWYGVASLLFVLLVGAAGALFLSQNAADEVAWQAPWFVLVIVSGALLWTLPFNAVLEGCNQVVAINFVRLAQAVTASLSVWIVMSAGGELWAAVAATTARLACDLFLLLIYYRAFFRPFWQPPTGAVVSWAREMWPMQWRLGVGAIFSYFAFFLLTPVMFHYHGPVLAGRMGMTWTVVTAIQAAALAWVHTRAPRFGMLIKQRDFDTLDRLFFRVSGFGFAAMLLGGSAFWCLVSFLTAGDYSVVERVLDPSSTLLLLLGATVQWACVCLAYYVRAHKQEPFLLVSVVSNSAVGLAVWLLGARFGPTGAGAGLLGILLLFTLPAHVLLWQRVRNDHDQEEAAVVHSGAG